MVWQGDGMVTDGLDGQEAVYQMGTGLLRMRVHP